MTRLPLYQTEKGHPAIVKYHAISKKTFQTPKFDQFTRATHAKLPVAILPVCENTSMDPVALLLFSSNWKRCPPTDSPTTVGNSCFPLNFHLACHSIFNGDKFVRV